MDILFTFKLKEAQEQALLNEFPNGQFHFNGTAESEEVSIAEVIVTYGGNITKELLDRAPNLKWLMVASAGVEQMDLAEIHKRGIVVTNVRGIHKTPMAESVLAHLLALKRSVYEVDRVQETKDWTYKFTSTELRGSTAIILGPGAIGMEIGRLLQAFGVRTIGCNRSGRQADFMDDIITFDQLLETLPEADIVVSILPNTKETTNLLTRVHFDAMKSSTIFLNFGRGNLFEEDILIDVLQKEQIHHAVLDVFKTEPLPEESPFWTLKNCTVSPHISAKSGKYVERALEIFHQNLRVYTENQKQLVNIVDVKRGY